jgi:hypothetical protein
LLRAAATREGDQIRVAWKPPADPDVARYVVVATRDGTAPVYPPRGGTKAVARTSGTSVVVAAVNSIRLRVVALTGDGRVAARSGVLVPN